MSSVYIVIQFNDGQIICRDVTHLVQAHDYFDEAVFTPQRTSGCTLRNTSASFDDDGKTETCSSSSSAHLASSSIPFSSRRDGRLVGNDHYAVPGFAVAQANLSAAQKTESIKPSAEKKNRLQQCDRNLNVVDALIASAFKSAVDDARAAETFAEGSNSIGCSHVPLGDDEKCTVPSAVKSEHSSTIGGKTTFEYTAKMKPPTPTETTPPSANSTVKPKPELPNSDVVAAVLSIMEQQSKQDKASIKKKTIPKKTRIVRRHARDPEVKEYVSEPADADVLCGRGTGSRLHPGNQCFYKKVGELREEYRLGTNDEKKRISISLVNYVKNAGGRFLKKDESGRYFVMHESGALTKACQALREHKFPEERQKTCSARYSSSNECQSGAPLIF